MFSTWDFKYLSRKADSDKALRDKTFNIAKNLKYDGYQRGFDIKSSGNGVNNEIKQNNY